LNGFKIVYRDAKNFPPRRTALNVFKVGHVVGHFPAGGTFLKLGHVVGHFPALFMAHPSYNANKIARRVGW